MLLHFAVENLLACALLHVLLHLGKFAFGEFFSGHDVELRAAALPGRVHLVALTCCGKRAALVEVARIHYLSIYFIIGAAGAELLSGAGVARVGIAGLYHEFIDYAVEKRAVVISFFNKFHEIVAVPGCVAV